MRDDEQALYDQIDRELAGHTFVAKLSPESSALSIESAAKIVSQHHRIIRFRGKPMIKVYEPFEHYTLIDRNKFEDIAYPLLGGISKGAMGNVFACICASAEDITANDHFILFGVGTKYQTVWDMDKLEIRTDIHPDDCFWRTPYRPSESRQPIPYIIQLAGGDTGIYGDIMQSIAPIIMGQKPDGVIWWTGDNVNANNTLTDALTRLFPSHLSHLSVRQLNGGRSSTGQLNYVIGNMAADNGQITDTEMYKYIGAHVD